MHVGYIHEKALNAGVISYGPAPATIGFHTVNKHFDLTAQRVHKLVYCQVLFGDGFDKSCSSSSSNSSKVASSKVVGG